MSRIIVRKTYDPERPLMYIELPNGTSVRLGGKSHGIVKSKEWTQPVFASVENDEYADWERMA